MVFCGVMSCSLTDVCQHFWWNWYLHFTTRRQTEQLPQKNGYLLIKHGIMSQKCHYLCTHLKCKEDWHWSESNLSNLSSYFLLEFLLQFLNSFGIRSWMNNTPCDNIWKCATYPFYWYRFKRWEINTLGTVEGFFYMIQNTAKTWVLWP